MYKNQIKLSKTKNQEWKIMQFNLDKISSHKFKLKIQIVLGFTMIKLNKTLIVS